MAAPNVRGVYELLQRAMQQNYLQQQGSGFCPMPNNAPGYDSDGYGNPQGGLLGRLLALDSQQIRYQPLAENNRAAPAVPPDPNFRQLLRVPPADPMQDASGALNQPDDRLSQPIPAIPEWWKAAGPMLRSTLSGAAGGGGGDDHSRCTAAADGSYEQWAEFCRQLERKQNNTVGGESQNRACWSKGLESPQAKKSWCDNQFGNY
jgi:hypothetical protein